MTAGNAATTVTTISGSAAGNTTHLRRRAAVLHAGPPGHRPSGPGEDARIGAGAVCRDEGGMGHLGVPWIRPAERGPLAWLEPRASPFDACVLAETARAAAATTCKAAEHATPGHADKGLGRVRHSLHPAHWRPLRDRAGLHRVSKVDPR